MRLARKLLFWRKPRVPVIELHGVLARRVGSLSLASHGSVIDAAFRAAKRRRDGGCAVVLDIDSPGGSPVQSDLIATRIRRRAEEHGCAVVAVVSEVGASGGYWLACAADEIVANPMSVVGSIGVVGGGFGFDEAIRRLGIERRLYTAGENKARLDPFSPERPQDVEYTKALMEDLHGRFKAWVRTRRGERLQGDDARLFDGSWMLGAQALEAGLIDRLGDTESVVHALGGDKAEPMVFRPRRRGLLGRLPRLGADALVDAVEARRFELRM